MTKPFLFLLILLTTIACSTTRKISNDNTITKSFSSAESKLILEKDSIKAMRVFWITNYSDSLLLRKKSKDVIPNPNDKVLQHFTNRLYKTVTDSMSLGVGIAAPQVGILSNIIWVQRFDKPDFPFEVYLNPKILQYSKKKQPCPEGCLSIPDKRGTTQNRAYAILLDYDKMDGSHVTEMVEDFTAVIFQHEIDHLNGILFIDHLEKEVKDAEGRK